ncbi:MAG: DUF5808 domain-containing protein [Bacteroidota bacterium]
MKNKFDREVNNPNNYKYGIFYYNSDDHRIFVPKRNRNMGWTLNFGNHFTYLMLGFIISAIILFNIFY